MILLLVALGIVVAIVVLAVVFVPMFFDESVIIELAQEKVRQATGGDLMVDGEAHLALFPSVAVEIDTVTLDIPAQQAGGERMLAKVGSIDIGLSPLGLVTGDTEIGQVMLTNIDLQTTAMDGEVASQVRIAELVAEGLNIANSPMGIRTQVEVVDLTGGAPLRVELDGTIRVNESIDRVSIDALNTTVTGALTEPVQSRLQGTVDLSPMKADLALIAQLPGGDIDGDLVYDESASPQIDLVFATERLDLDRIQPAGGNSTSGEAPEQTPEPEESDPVVQGPPVPLPVGPLRNLDLRLEVTADALLTSGQEINNAQLLMRVVNGIADLEYLRGLLHQGQLDTTMKIDARKPIVRVDLEGGLKGFDIDSLTTSLDSPNTAKGRLDMAWDLDTKGKTVEDVKVGLDGDLTLNGTNVEITAASAQDAMCQAIAQINQEEISTPMPTTTPVTALAMEVEFAGGMAELEAVDLSIPGITIGGSGTASLATHDFEASLSAGIDETLETLDPACRVNERYASIGWPVACQGNLMGEPASWCGIDTESILKQLLQNEAKSQIQKQAEKLGGDAGKLLKNLFGD